MAYVRTRYVTNNTVNTVYNLYSNETGYIGTFLVPGAPVNPKHFGRNVIRIRAGYIYIYTWYFVYIRLSLVPGAPVNLKHFGQNVIRIRAAPLSTRLNTNNSIRAPKIPSFFCVTLSLAFLTPLG